MGASGASGQNQLGKSGWTVFRCYVEQQTLFVKQLASTDLLYFLCVCYDLQCLRCEFCMLFYVFVLAYVLL